VVAYDGDSHFDAVIDTTAIGRRPRSGTGNGHDSRDGTRTRKFLNENATANRSTRGPTTTRKPSWFTWMKEPHRT